MKAWFIEDDCTSKAANIWVERMKATTKEEAAQELRDEWDRLTRVDKKRRDSFKAIYAEPDEDGGIDYDTVTDEVTI